MIETGTILQQRYKIDKQIGQGGMGAVYVATDERFGSTVAIKETLCMDANFRKAIEREARLLNSLKHSALPRVSDHFEESNGQFLVMEYIPGDDVACILERDQRAFPVHQVLTWADQLLDALDYLHNQDIPVIHRDIKPQNLKITPRGQIILLDFGLAKGNPTDAGHQTAAKSIFGYSRNYASLEQIQGTGTDPRSDLYSLAATLYHLITNTAPEDALTRAMSVLSQRPDPLIPASSLDGEIPRGVAGVLHKALDLNADGRPASAAEMRQMLSESEDYAYLAGEVTIASAGADVQVFAQATKLMPDETLADVIKQTDVKTEVLPSFLSEVTSVSRAGGAGTNAAAAQFTSAPAQKPRGFAMAAGALSVFLVGAAVAGGIYVVKPSMFGGGPDVENTVTTEPAEPQATSVSNQNAPSASESSVAPEGTLSTTAEVRPPEPAEKPVETTKNNKGTGTGKTNQAAASDEITVDDADLPGEVTTVKPAPRPPDFPANGTFPFPRGFDPSKLTPEERRRMKNRMNQMWRNYPGNRPVPPANRP